MLCLKEMPTKADGRLCRATPRRDGTGEIAWDIDVSFNMTDEADAVIANQYVPGALQSWRAGQEGAKGSVKSSSGYDLLHVTITDAGSPTTEKIASGHADIRHCVVNVNGQEAALVIRLRVHGLLPHSASALVYKLDEIITLALDTHQLHLFGSSEPEVKPETENDLCGRVALIEVDEEQSFCGLVVEQSDQSVVVQTIELGRIEVTQPYKVASSILVVPQSGFHFDELLGTYQEEMEKIGGPASWHDLIESIGMMYASNQIEAQKVDGEKDFAFELNGDVIKKTIVQVSNRMNGGL